MNRINLNQIAKKEVEMKKNEMKAVRGGKKALDNCACVCMGSRLQAEHGYSTSSNSAL